MLTGAAAELAYTCRSANQMHLQHATMMTCTGIIHATSAGTRGKSAVQMAAATGLAILRVVNRGIWITAHPRIYAGTERGTVIATASVEADLAA